MIAPANTRNDNNSKKAVIKILQTNRRQLCICIPRVLILKIVVMKLIAPNNDDTPAKCKLKIAMSTDRPLCAAVKLNIRYTVQPVPAPPSI